MASEKATMIKHSIAGELPEDRVRTDDDAERVDSAQLVRQFHAVLFRYAYRLTGSNSDAEDLTQQTFLTAHQKLGGLRDMAKVKSWLFTVMRNTYLKGCRKQRPVPAGNIELDVDNLPARLPREDEIDRQALQLALDELTDDYKVVLVMFYFEELSYKEIGEKLALPLGTVMSRLSRAKGHLRQRLLSRGFGDEIQEAIPRAAAAP